MADVSRFGGRTFATDLPPDGFASEVAEAIRKEVTTSPERKLVEDVAAWSIQTFPGQTVAGRAAHLEREVKELRADPSNAEEAADCLMLLFSICVMQGNDPFEAVAAKFAIVRTRRWGPLDAEGVSEHIRD